MDSAAATNVAEAYYDSPDADAFYSAIWGGEDIHVGIYEDGDTIAEASRRTVAHMAARLQGLGPEARVLDLGSGYGGAARFLASRFGAHVTCVNLSDVENERNRELTAARGLSDRIKIVHGAFEDAPEPDAAFDVVWSQDAFLHSADRRKALSEAHRTLKPGGELIFTDPMQIDALEDASVLRPIYDRIHLENLATVEFYRSALAELGMEEVGIELMTDQLTMHYARVRAELEKNRETYQGRISGDYIERMLSGLSNWVDAGRAAHLVWGVLHFRKAGA
ncbi:MAG: SAM-dependent methyltransferase [Parvularculaceae bacterium]